MCGECDLIWTWFSSYDGREASEDDHEEGQTHVLCQAPYSSRVLRDHVEPKDVLVRLAAGHHE